MTRAGVQSFQRLDLSIGRRINGLLQGDHEGLGLGPGSEPEEVTRYRPGEDDVRRIDWNVSARTQDLHVWRPRAEHELDTWVLLDTTASMAFGSVDLEKGEVAQMVVGAIALLTDRPGNRVGLGRLTERGLAWERALPPRTAARAALAPPRAGRRTLTPAATLGEAVDQLDRRHRKQGLRVVVSDFLSPDGRLERPFEWESGLRRLGQRHDVIAVEIVDPRELTLPDVGSLVLVDPESGRRREVHTSSSLRRRYAEGAAAHRAAVAESMRAARASHVVLRTDRDWVRDLAAFVRRRAITGARAGSRGTRVGVVR